MKQGEKLDMQVYLGNKQKLPVRLIIEKVPNSVAAEKRRKLKTDKQNKRKILAKNVWLFVMLMHTSLMQIKIYYQLI